MMWKALLVWLCLHGCCAAVPFGHKRNMPIMQREEEPTAAAAAAAATENEVTKPEADTAADKSETAAAPPSMPKISTLTLPSNATSIRADITDGFSCTNKSYGYYADVENDCQIFHVCLPVTYADGKENTFRWSFICPEETIFSQDSFTCMRREDMTIDCEDSFQYYELNRNFGLVEEETNNKHMQNNEPQTMSASGHAEEDQLTAMTQHLPAEQPQRQPPKQQLQENANEEKIMQPATLASAAVNTEKQKPAKMPKPNRRKPATAAASLNGIKKKPLRKATATTTTAPQLATTTLPIDLPADTEAKPTPTKFSKRPVMSTNLKEKPQPAKQADTVPIRIELYNQKRKRPTFLNKKEAATTTKPLAVETATEAQSTERVASLAEQPAATPAPSDNVAPQASETSEVFVQPAAEPNTSETKKVSQPQPTEPEVGTNAAGGTLEEMPAMQPLEAYVEIPAIIAEVEQSNTNEVSPVVADVDAAATSIEEQPTAAVEEPSIFQQNSEEHAANAPSIEEMEEQKPADAPETVTATLGMEHQQPMVEQMFEETMAAEDKKQTMGGFKPVDPAMAAEAEALIANFLNTLMKSEQSSAASKPSEAEIEEPQASTENENENEKEASKVETTQNVEAHETSENQAATTEKIAALAPIETPKKEPLSPLPSIMMMQHHPNDIFQIPVQVIQTPIEELTVPAQPLSIDDVVERVKEQLDQQPAAEAAQTPVPSTVETAEQAAPITNDESKYQKLGEELILPIYHRGAAIEQPKTDEQRLRAPSEKLAESLENAAAPIETENKPTATQSAAKGGRAERARSIKTASSMDPRKRRFLFRSDAS